jgi:transketolase
MEHSDLTNLCINTIRALGADQPQAANSGHPGAPMGMAPMAHVLWTEFMNYSPHNPKWFNRDRFVLSNGHACALLYAMLHLTGYDLSLDDLKAFRQLESKTPGHPEANHTPGVEVTTGPLGQGFANGVGFAIAEHHLAARFNKPDFEIINNYIYVFCGDGCLQEGISSEASSLAGHLGLGRLIVLYDDNHVTIDGDTDLAFTENVKERYEAYGWHVQEVHDGDHDVDAIRNAIREAQRITDKPSLIKVRTTIGFGSAKQGTAHVHGSPLGEDDLAAAKRKLGIDPSTKFYIPEQVKKFYSQFPQKGAELEKAWNEKLEEYARHFPELGAELKRRISGELPDGWQNVLPRSKASDPENPTRKLSGICLNKLAEVLPEIVGGSADLNPSTLTYLQCSKDFQKGSYEGRNIRFGVREHAMAAICNGLAAYGAVIPFGSTFLNFIGYAFGAVTLSCISQVGVLYIMTHDSIGLGEDGPTHQPTEKFVFCRATPGLYFIRPCDGNEVAAAYISAITHRRNPTVMALSRQNLPAIAGSSVEGALRGAYPVVDPAEGRPELILVSTGSEVSLCTQAAAKLAGAIKVRVISMPCWELFEEQDPEYKSSVFIPGVPVISVEAGSTMGWSKYAHTSIGVDRFGFSGPYKAVYAHVGLTVEAVIDRARQVVEFYAAHPAPVLGNMPTLAKF